MNGYVIQITISPTSFPVTDLAPAGRYMMEFTVGSFPHVVKSKKNLMISFDGDDWSGGTYIPPVYVVFDTPNPPQVSPWLGVLDDACEWTEGQGTQDNVAKEITRGVFFGHDPEGFRRRFFYPNSPATIWVDVDKDTDNDGTVDYYGDNKFRLSDFLEEDSWVPGNCTDVATYVAICQNSIGLNFCTATYFGDESNPDGKIQTNPICAIGSDPAFWVSYDPHFSHPTPLYRWRWGYHQVAHPVGSTDVYDACVAQWYDLSGNVYQNPPVKWPLSAYWCTEQGNYSNNQPGRGLVKTPINSTPSMYLPPSIPEVK